jgi:hypothetical protein
MTAVGKITTTAITDGEAVRVFALASAEYAQGVADADAASIRPVAKDAASEPAGTTGETFEHQASTDGKAWQTVAVGLDPGDVDAYRAENATGEGSSWRMLPEGNDKGRATAAKAAELAAAERRWNALCEWRNYGNSRTKQFGRRADGNLRRAAEARRLVERLTQELETLRRPVRVVPPLDLERLPFATHIRTDVGWYEVVKVNRKSVKVVVDPGWDDLIPIKRIKEIHERPVKTAPAEVAAEHTSTADGLNPADMGPTQTTTVSVGALRGDERIVLDGGSTWVTVDRVDEADDKWLLHLVGQPEPVSFPQAGEPHETAVRVLVDEMVEQRLRQDEAVYVSPWATV